MRMVSRKGFSQWYPIRDFAELHLLAGRYADQLAHFQKSAATTTPLQPPNLTALASNFADHEPRAKVLGPNSASTSNIQPIEADQKKIKLSRKEQKRAKKEARKADRVSPQVSAQVEQSISPHRTRKRTTFDDQYLLVASRLRLGNIKSPLVHAFVYAPLTLFLYWGPWFKSTAEELSWHLSGSSRINFVLPLWMVMIPGVHFIFAWILASQLADVERQNGYLTVRPWLATLLAFFPPFYILYIQAGTNRHWKLHIYNSPRPA